MRHAVAIALLLAACTDSSSSSSGPGITAQVEYHDILASDGGVCIEGTLFDADPNTPGPQYDCSVTELAADQTETVLPQCNNTTSPMTSTNKPCWAIETSATCTANNHEIAMIERDAQPVAGTHVIIQCVTQ